MEGLAGTAGIFWFGISAGMGSSRTSLTKHNRRASETPKFKTDIFRTLTALLIGVSVNESLCTKKTFQSFFRGMNAAQNKLAFISQVQGFFCNSMYFLFPNECGVSKNRVTVKDKI